MLVRNVCPGDRLHDAYYTGPVNEFVIRLYVANTTHQLRQYVVGADRRTLTMTDVAPGDYSVWILELNDSGLSAGIMDDVTVPAPPSPSPTPARTTPAPSPSPTSTTG